MSNAGKRVIVEREVGRSTKERLNSAESAGSRYRRIRSHTRHCVRSLIGDLTILEVVLRFWI